MSYNTSYMDLLRSVVTFNAHRVSKPTGPQSYTVKRVLSDALSTRISDIQVRHTSIDQKVTGLDRHFPFVKWVALRPCIQNVCN